MGPEEAGARKSGTASPPEFEYTVPGLKGTGRKFKEKTGTDYSGAPQYREPTLANSAQGARWHSTECRVSKGWAVETVKRGCHCATYPTTGFFAERADQYVQTGRSVIGQPRTVMSEPWFRTWIKEKGT
ncbi:hypothetical protein [Arthrobacter silvisoli]|uniref:hypothetical protein n=1 Tax=Arthrobacter silvisoli TaxID=2291022 RepID=UPI00109B8320|nr:hypothetical protein [Arthrobacter silvisoli]